MTEIISAAVYIFLFFSEQNKMYRFREMSPPSEMPYTSPPDTLMHSMASLMDANLADVHAELERNMAVIRRILQVLENRRDNSNGVGEFDCCC